MTTTSSSKKKASAKKHLLRCDHKIDPEQFPTEKVGAYLVGRCVRCACLVALKVEGA